MTRTPYTPTNPDVAEALGNCRDTERRIGKLLSDLEAIRLRPVGRTARVIVTARNRDLPSLAKAKAGSP